MQKLKVNEVTYNNDKKNSRFTLKGMLSNKLYTLSIRKAKNNTLPEIKVNESTFDVVLQNHLLTAEETADFISKTNLDIIDKKTPIEKANQLQETWKEARRKGFTNYGDIVTVHNIERRPSGRDNPIISTLTLIESEKRNVVTGYESFSRYRG